MRAGVDLEIETGPSAMRLSEGNGREGGGPDLISGDQRTKCPAPLEQDEEYWAEAREEVPSRREKL